MTKKMKYCTIRVKQNKQGIWKKHPTFKKTKDGRWGSLPKSKANAAFIEIPKGMYVIDIDTKKIPKKYKKWVASLGSPTRETANGFHYDIKSTTPLTNHQNIFKDENFKVDIKTEGGLIFVDYWGNSKHVWYKTVGKAQKDKGYKIFTSLPTHVKEPKKKVEILEREEVGKIELDNIQNALGRVDIMDYKAEEDWFHMLASIYHGGGAAAEDIAREWSKGDKDTYDRGSFDKKWDRLLSGDFGENFSVKTLFKASKGDEPTEGMKKENGSVHNLSPKQKKEAAKERKKNPIVVKKPQRFNKYGIDWNMFNKIKSQIMYIKQGDTYQTFNNDDRWIGIGDKDIKKAIEKFFEPFSNLPKKIKELNDESDKLTEKNLKLFAKNGGVIGKKENKIGKRQDAIKNEKVKMEKRYTSYINKLKEEVRLENQYETKHIEIDPFKKETSIKKVGNDIHVTLCDIFYNVEIKKPQYDTRPYLKDFKKHFSHFDEFMGLIIAARFASNRKKAYLHTKMISDFGKSFLGGVFSQLGLLVEMDMGEMRKAVRGEPSGVDPKGFISAWILQFDEVKYIPAELKKIYNEITIAAKGQQRMTVPTYVKWLSSAEDIQGMKGVGADKQIANRLSAWDMGNKTLDSRKLFAADNAKYFIALKWEIYMIVKKAVEARVRMGKAKSYLKSQKFITKFHNKYGIEATLDETVGEFKDELMDHIKEVAGSFTDVEGVDELIRSDFDVVNDELIAYRVGKFDNIFKTLSKKYYGDDSKAIDYKSNVLREMFSDKQKNIYNKETKKDIMGYILKAS